MRKKQQIISLIFFSICMAVVSLSYIYFINIDIQSRGSSILPYNTRRVVRHLSSRLVSKKLNQNQSYRFKIKNTSQFKQSLQQREEELIHLGDLIKRRLLYLQNPRNCTAARKVICVPNKAGFGSSLHQLTFCLIVAYATRRTLILNSRNWIYAKEGWETLFLPVSTNCTSAIDTEMTYDIEASKNRHVIKLPQMQQLLKIPDFMPFAIPMDIADKLERIHMNPSLWWIGQFVDYLIRPKNELKLYIQKHQEKILSMRPKVGIHVRRTDKIHDTSYFNVEEYMTHVETFVENNLNNKTHTKYVYIATDAPSVIQEAKQKYPSYTFIYHEEAMNVDKEKRYSVSSLKMLLSEVYNLAICDFVICTMSSNICRFVRELKESTEWNASERFVSLDTDYPFHIRPLGMIRGLTNSGNLTAPKMTKLTVLKELKKKQRVQKYSLDIKKSRVVMPVYPEIKEIM